MTIRILHSLGIACIVSLASLTAAAQAPAPAAGPLAAIETALLAHKAWPVTPATMKMTGDSTRNGVTEPVTITVSRQEQSIAAYGPNGEKKQVSTSSLFFNDDGSKATFERSLAGFSQLDMSSVFLLSELRTRPVKIDELQTTTVFGAPAFVFHVVNAARTQLHYGRSKVTDEFDLYVNQAGQLTGISRTFYRDLPGFTATQAYSFSDYRETGGVLLPFRIERYINGKNVETIAVTSYAFDVAAPASIFEPRRVSR
jgi:hypothetical protein